MSTSTPPRSVVIDGVRYIPDDNTPDRASVWYMHDNHTFTALKGGLSEIIEKAKQLGRDSHYGMLCPVRLLKGKKEIRRLNLSVHAQLELGDTSRWEAEIRADPDALRLLEGTSSVVS